MCALEPVCCVPSLPDGPGRGVKSAARRCSRRLRGVPTPTGHALHGPRLASARGLRSQGGLVCSHPGRGGSTVPRILLAWLPVAPPCPQDRGSRPGHRGQGKCCKARRFTPALSVPGEKRDRAREESGPVAQALRLAWGSPVEPDPASRCCGRSSSLPAANASNYTNVAQQMRRGVVCCQPASRPLPAAPCSGLCTGTQDPGPLWLSWSSSCVTERQCPGPGQRAPLRASLPGPARRGTAVTSPAGARGLYADQPEGMSLRFLICKRA